MTVYTVVGVLGMHNSAKLTYQVELSSVFVAFTLHFVLFKSPIGLPGIWPAIIRDLEALLQRHLSWQMRGCFAYPVWPALEKYFKVC